MMKLKAPQREQTQWEERGRGGGEDWEALPLVVTGGARLRAFPAFCLGDTFVGLGDTLLGDTLFGLGDTLLGDTLFGLGDVLLGETCLPSGQS